MSVKTTARRRAPMEGAMQPDLFATVHPPCGDCRHLGAAINTGVRYCHGLMMWRWATERFDCATFSAGVRS